VTSITVVSGNNPWVTGIEKHLAEYEALTGVDVNIETYGNEQLNDQYKVRLNSSDSEFDVMVFQVQDVMREFSRNQWLTDVTDRVSEDSEWNWEDFQPSSRDAAELDGVVYGVPLMTERHVMYYRKDLLDAAGIAVPTTLEELEAAAAALNDPANNMTGIAMRGQRVQSVTQFSSFLYSYGGDFQDGTKATIDTPEAIAAYEMYGKLLSESGPQGVTSMGWVEASALFAQGRAAFYLDADSQAYTFLDPTSSAIVDTVAYAPFPAGPAGAHPYSIVPWTAGINAFSEQKDAAWDFIKWATSEDMFAQLMAEDTVPSPRDSSWQNSDAISAFPQGLVDNVTATAQTAVGHDRPQLEQVARAREFVGGPVVTAIEGGDVAKAAADANALFQELLDSDGQ
jgi:multiple sugar transport system substrate-binding protein